MRKKHHKHSSSAWKVALADFAIAMMAFFLLLWLLNTATVEQKEAMSQYFEDPIAYMKNIKIKRIMENTSNFTEKNINQNTEQKYENPEIKKMEKLRRKFMSHIAKIDILQKYKEHIYLDITDEGLRIQIIDQTNKAMFARSSSEMLPEFVEILQSLAIMINTVNNRISITGHTDANPFKGYEISNWELSSQRANSARRALVAGGVEEIRIARVVGLASNLLLDANDPGSSLNRRISIVILSKDLDELKLQLEKNLNKKLIK